MLYIIANIDSFVSSVMKQVSQSKANQKNAGYNTVAKAPRSIDKGKRTNMN
jgi:hypothetical protein